MTAPILNQDTPSRRPRLWLISGTGEGPPLARVLLRRGWRLRVQVVGPEAARAYPMDPHLELVVGPLAGAAAVAAAIGQARRQQQPYRWLVDASHPFASRISAALAEACAHQGQPLLRLARPMLSGDEARICADAAALANALAPGERVLLALGGRHLGSLLAGVPPIIAHARLLPRPGGLRQALAAGLPASRLACLQPGGDGAIEAALCRQWRINTVIARQSGGVSEALWRRLCRRQHHRLLLLARPSEPPGVEALPLAQLLVRLGSPEAPPGGSAWSPQTTSAP
ncbi:MAG: precorrin-6A/cobalt-precorrin-6A reductase [Cyanobacteriota bacterium]|nr:precorrin-6A/cobalt-precorrin-6A reductase [Cyanobacteriota bacterium]